MAQASSHSLEWNRLPEELQLTLAQQALRRAALLIADQAELFAAQFAVGTLADRGAADALRLFGALLRETSTEWPAVAGSA